MLSKGDCQGGFSSSSVRDQGFDGDGCHASSLRTGSWLKVHNVVVKIIYSACKVFTPLDVSPFIAFIS